jgi:DNA-binding NarL/FixJ family response regulator
VVTSQPPDAAVSPDMVARTIARLAGTPGAVRQHLGPLSSDEVATVLADRVGRAVAPEVVAAGMRHSDGNPYRLLEWLAAGGAAAETVTTDLPELTARELEVLSCLAEGMSNKQVARSLGISIRTVTVHVSNLLRKTRSTSRTEAALWALRHR